MSLLELGVTNKICRYTRLYINPYTNAIEAIS